jgi:hypothetical protein
LLYFLIFITLVAALTKPILLRYVQDQKVRLKWLGMKRSASRWTSSSKTSLVTLPWEDFKKSRKGKSDSRLGNSDGEHEGDLEHKAEVEVVSAGFDCAGHTMATCA